MISAILVAGVLALAFGVVLGYAAVRFKVEGNPVVDKIDAMLPQTQCGQCGFPGCRPYAEAIAKGEAEINLCPPGGESGMLSLAQLLDKSPVPFDETLVNLKEDAVALIDEQSCIGCTLCIQACPVDAILGTSKQMHTVIASECTGCELCLPPCPVDCIQMIPVKKDLRTWKWPYPIVAQPMLQETLPPKAKAA